MPRLLIGIILFAFCSCKSKPSIDDKLIYSTLNEIILQDTIFAGRVCSRFDKAFVPQDIQQEFLASDKDFVQEQINSSTSKCIREGSIDFYWKKTKRLEKAIIDSSCTGFNFLRINYPIFSKDLQTVIVGFSEDQSGFHAVYKKQNGKWKLIKEFGRWIE